MKKIFAIDPGTKESAYVQWDGKRILDMGIRHNMEIIINLYQMPPMDLVVEQVRSYGMAIGATTLDTVFWSGRFCEAWPGDWSLMPRMDVKMHLCHNSRANDSNIRQALIDRFEPDLKPRQRPKGILKGVSKDIWAALALGVTWWDKNTSNDLRE